MNIVFQKVVDIITDVIGAAEINKCDPSEQKQPFGCTLTNPLHVTPLRPGSTFIDGFSRAIYQKIADFNSYPLRYQY